MLWNFANIIKDFFNFPITHGTKATPDSGYTPVYGENENSLPLTNVHQKEIIITSITWNFGDVV